MYICNLSNGCSESQVTLYPLPELAPPTLLLKAKSAFSFAIHTSVQHILPNGTTVKSSDAQFSKATTVPTVVTNLIVGCRRKLVIYSWKDGEAQEVKVCMEYTLVYVDL